MDPPTERASVVLFGFDDSWVLCKDILPVSDPMVRPTVIRQKLINFFRTFIGRAIRHKSG